MPESDLIYYSIDNPTYLQQEQRKIRARSSKKYRRKTLALNSTVAQQARRVIEDLMADADSIDLSAIDVATMSDGGFLSLYDIEKHNLPIRDGYAEVGHVHTRFIFGRAVLTDGSIVDPCVLYPPCDYENIRWHPRHIAGNAVATFEPSPFLLPPKIRAAANQRPEVMRQYFLPLLVSINNDMKYLVPDNSTFFQCGEFTGNDVDPDHYADPDREQLYRMNYTEGRRLFPAVIYTTLPGINDLLPARSTSALREIIPVHKQR